MSRAMEFNEKRRNGSDEMLVAIPSKSKRKALVCKVKGHDPDPKKKVPINLDPRNPLGVFGVKCQRCGAVLYVSK